MNSQIQFLKDEIKQLHNSVKELNKMNTSINHEIDLLHKAHSQLKAENQSLGRQIARIESLRKTDQIIIRDLQKIDFIHKKFPEVHRTNQMAEKRKFGAKADKYSPNVFKLKTTEKSVKPIENENTVENVNTITKDVEVSSIDSQSTAVISEIYGETFWKVKKVKEKIMEAKKSLKSESFSAPFYSHENGYKLCLVACFGGLMRGNCLLVDFSLMTTEHSDQLSWPFKFNVRFELINQIDYSVYTSKTIKFDPDKNIGKWERPTSDKNETNNMYGLTNLTELLANDDLYQNDEIWIRGVLEEV